MAKSETLFGISFPQWDLMTRTFPGLVFVCVSWAMLLRCDWAEHAWNELISTWYLWIGVALLGFVIGVTIDSWSWCISDKYAKCLQRRTDASRQWEDIWAFVTTKCRESNLPEADSMDKVQIETKFLINTGILLIAELLIVLVLSIFVDPSTSLAYQKCGGSLYWLILVAMPCVGIFFLFLAFLRQRRRVMGANAIIDSLSQDFTKFLERKHR